MVVRTRVVQPLDTKKEHFNQGYTSTACPFQSQVPEIMKKNHLNFVHLCLGSKRSSGTYEWQCLSTQGAVAADLICFKVTHCSKEVTFFNFLAEAKNVLSNPETNVV